MNIPRASTPKSCYITVSPLVHYKHYKYWWYDYELNNEDKLKSHPIMLAKIYNNNEMIELLKKYANTHQIKLKLVEESYFSKLKNLLTYAINTNDDNLVKYLLEYANSHKISLELNKILNNINNNPLINSTNDNMNNLLMEYATNRNIILCKEVETTLPPFSFFNRGYSCTTENETDIIYTIGMGWANISDEIELQNVKIKGENVIVYINENFASRRGMMLCASHCPKISLKFNRKPKKIKIVNSKTGENFKELELEDVLNTNNKA
ncbi:hypothetical protein BCR32DRAFT_269554 [Anaeromyces robustus]|uniref:Uncharacterized protein n=1 Tax=Anaeromyces robustus TaxID=1754192 RepID=A0A1Y1X0K9_9FUNG|nr:hypothetical protein BCR32DRAFT_269554 [Anaeromyces robustus]|eukprot:ORX79293.1 hypothetical protein BCR32DRAFT_269554 [Anaeromyces robustus]